MKKEVKNYFAGEKIFFFAALFFIFLIISTGILSPLIINTSEENWKNKSEQNFSKIETEATQIFQLKQKELLNNLSLLKKKLVSGIRVYNADKVLEIIQSDEFSKYSIQIIDENENLLFWNKEPAISKERFFPLKFQIGETYFHKGSLISYLSVIDTLFNGEYFVSLNLPVEKKYEIQNKYFEEISFTSELNEKFLTLFKIQFSKNAQKSKDGRERTFYLRNNIGNIIGAVTFIKPLKDNYINSLKELFFNLQAGFSVLAFLFLSIGIYFNIKRSKNNKYTFLYMIFCIIIFRFLIFILKLPSKFIEGPLSDPAFFASKFAFGIVKSPVEFLITTIFGLIVCIIIYEKAIRYFINKNYNSKRFIKIFVIAVSSFLFLILLRGLASSMRSVIFDSNLRYFKEPGLIPNMPILVMQVGVLFVALSVVLVSISIIYFNLKNYHRESGNFYFTFFTLFVFYQLAGICYDQMQVSPQATSFIRILFIFLIFIIVYKIYTQNKISSFNYVYFALISSITAIFMLNYYNTQIEKDSLKTTAIELTRINENWLEFITTETLMNASEDEDLKNTMLKGGNYVAAAFNSWSRSSFQRNNLNSTISILDRDKRILGSFGMKIPDEFRIHPDFISYNEDDIKIFNKIYSPRLNGNLISGVISIKDSKDIIGYVAVTTLFKPNSFTLGNFPEFLSNDQNIFNNTINFEDLNILIFQNERLLNSYGEIIPSNENIEKILKAEFNDDNEAWLDLKITNENFLLFLLRAGEKGNEKIYVTALKEKNLSWGLYNFLKIFFLHSIIILLYLLIYFSFKFNYIRNLGYTFRTQLMISFLLISIVPLIFLGYYNKKISDERELKEISYQLNQKAETINSFLLKNYSEEKSLKNLFNEAKEALELNFNVYKENKNIFSTKDELIKAGILNSVIDPNVKINIDEYGYREFLNLEKIENYKYYSYYLKTNLSDEIIILNINNIFNEIYTDISGEDVNIFLFGSYSLAVLLIIIFSAFFSNKISMPIKKLTNATTAVSSGDLDYEVDHISKGEINDLIKGFNSMIRDLKKNQIVLSEFEREIAWKEMARQVAHEIKNPLTPMKLAMQQLVIAYKDRSNKFEEILNKVSKTIISQIEILSNIAGEFSNFARMPNLKIEKLDLVNVVEDSVNLFLQEKINIKIKKNKDSILIDADKDQLKRTIINLIRNSLQANADLIKINISNETEKAILTIEDNGNGISTENIDRIFEQNFTTKTKGMGLGLKMSKKFIESIGGKIYYSVPESNGAKFIIELKKEINGSRNNY